METARLLAAGDPDGLQRLVEDYGGQVRRTLRMDFKNSLDDSELDDALNQATHRVWNSRDRIDLTRGTLRAWYYAIARNRALRLLEKKRHPNALHFVEDVDALATNAPERRNDQPLSAALQRCVERLPRMQKSIVLADLASGGTAATDALTADLGTTANTVYVARNAARKNLRTCLEAQRSQASEGPIASEVTP